MLPRYEVASLSDAVESADIDNNGDIDIVVNGEDDIASIDPLVKILKNNGNGRFAPAIDYTPARNFADMKLRDINGDGFVDLIFAPDGNFPSYHFGRREQRQRNIRSDGCDKCFMLAVKALSMLPISITTATSTLC